MPKYDRLPTFDDKFIRVVIETPRGAAAKFSYDADEGVFAYSHPLLSASLIRLIGVSFPRRSEKMATRLMALSFIKPPVRPGLSCGARS